MDERDLTRFIASGGEQAMERVQAQLTPGESQLAGFDPLMNANFAIWSNALEGGGMYLMGADEEGNPYCPLCELKKNTDVDPSEWIKFAADEQLERARALRLVPGVQ